MTRTPRLELIEAPGGLRRGFDAYNRLARHLDGTVNPHVEGSTPSPPADPQEGQCWWIPNSVDANGEWKGHELEMAQWYSERWWFRKLPYGSYVMLGTPGMLMFVNADGELEEV